MQGTAAGLGAVALSGIPNIAQAQETQESKMPSANEIENMTRETLSPAVAKVKDARKSGKYAELTKALDEVSEAKNILKPRYFGNQNMDAGFDAFHVLIAPLNLQRDKYRERKDKREILAAIEGRINEATQKFQERDIAAAAFIRVTAEYMSGMEDYLALEKSQASLHEAQKALRAIQDVAKGTGAHLDNEPTVNVEGKKPDAEQVRLAAVNLARANDKLLQLHTP